MKLILQRVSSASVVVDQKIVGNIGSGLMILTGFGKEDEQRLSNNPIQLFDKAAQKIANLRIFENSDGNLDHSLLDVDGDVLLVPQFTLYGKASKGRRPDFTDALHPDMARQAFLDFREHLAAVLDKPVPSGVFGANMSVSLVNEGPLTLSLEF